MLSRFLAKAADPAGEGSEGASWRKWFLRFKEQIGLSCEEERDSVYNHKGRKEHGK